MLRAADSQLFRARAAACFALAATCAAAAWIASPAGADDLVASPLAEHVRPVEASDAALPPEPPALEAVTPDSLRATPLAAEPLPAAPLPAEQVHPAPLPAEPLHAEQVRVLKSERRIQLISGDEVLSEYRIALGSAPVGKKLRVGDGRTPEGRYVLDWRTGESDYYRAIHISYPNEADRAAARSKGFEPGGAIMIHGLPNGLGLIGEDHAKQDWTDGCIAVTNEEMDEIWRQVPEGTPIEIHP